MSEKKTKSNDQLVIETLKKNIEQQFKSVEERLTQYDSLVSVAEF